jgi:hypothetical protein
MDEAEIDRYAGLRKFKQTCASLEPGQPPSGDPPAVAKL